MIREGNPNVSIERDPREMALPQAVQNVGDEMADHLDAILRLFKPGAKITVVVRRPDAPDHSQDFIQTNDTLDDAIAALERRKNPIGTLEGRS